MAKRKGEFEVRGVWNIYKQMPRAERRKVMQALRVMLRGKSIDDLREVAMPVIDLKPGVMHCPFCDTPLTPSVATYGQDENVNLHCRPCERGFQQVKQ